MTLIPITEQTLDLIESLNSGVRPEVESGIQTYFVYNGEDKHSEIIDMDEAAVRRLFDTKQVTIYI